MAVDFLPPAVINATLHKVADQLSTGVLRPLRHISHSMGSVAAAFRQMIQASHVGKVVVSAEGAGAGAAPPALQPRSYPAVAITGGSGGWAWRGGEACCAGAWPASAGLSACICSPS